MYHAFLRRLLVEDEDLSGLHIGSRGTQTRDLQKMLVANGSRLTVDGVFGHTTDRAIREFQRRSGLFPPDGIPGENTLAALRETACRAKPNDISPVVLAAIMRQQQAPKSGIVLVAIAAPVGTAGPLAGTVAATRSWAKLFPTIFSLASSPKMMRTSPAGLLFIAAEEEQAGVSNHLHFPGGASGVTLGPGYDMRDRSPGAIIDALTDIDVDPVIAKAVSAASGKRGNDAKDFVDKNKRLITITTIQQAGLLRNIIGHYEGIVQRALTRDLYDHEFDALVSFAYNPGGGWHPVTRSINAGNYKDAMISLSQQVHSGGKTLPGLVKRRSSEINLFLYGKYK